MPSQRQTMFRNLSILFLIVAVLAGVLLLAFFFTDASNKQAIFGCGAIFTAALLAAIWFRLDTEHVRVMTTHEMLSLASDLVSYMDQGLNQKSAQKICEKLLPVISGVAVAITDTEYILGYEGVSEDGRNPSGMKIRTQATRDTLEDGKMRVMMSAQEIGFKGEVDCIKAAIIVPLKISGKVLGTMKFYYAKPRSVNELQQSIAEGFGDLLSTQLAAAKLEEQEKLAASMELRALQTQINPHFLFNTLNTIAAFCRIDPNKARVLLREFATFYRRTLENSSDLISIEREVEQTERYFMFEKARFGEDNIFLSIDVPEELREILIPAFIIQPIVENAVRHARSAERPLHVHIKAYREGDDLCVVVGDDGVGMSEEKRQNILNAKSDTGLGIAIRNINNRVTGYFGPQSSMTYTSEVDKGTVVTLYLVDGCKPQE